MKNDKLFNRIFSVTLMLAMAVVIITITATNYSTAGGVRDRVLLLVAAGASLCGVLSVILASNARIANFIFGLINVAVYGTVCLLKSNYGSAAINLLYFLPMQFVGLAAWKRHGGSAKTQVQARRLSKRGRLLVSGLFLAGLVIVYIILCAVRTENGATLGERLLAQDGDLVTLRWIIVVDAMATVCNLIGQYLLSTAFMEQWFFWIIVNISSVVMWSLTAARDVATGQSASLASIYIVKYAFYLVNALNGLRIWMNLSRKVVPVLAAGLLLLTAASCSGDINLEDKQVETISVTDITEDSAILTGYVATGEFWGFILSSSKDFLNTGMPIYVDEKDENQLYRVRVTGLDPGTTYYVTAAILQDPKTELGDMAFGRTLPFKTKKR